MLSSAVEKLFKLLCLRVSTENTHQGTHKCPYWMAVILPLLCSDMFFRMGRGNRCLVLNLSFSPFWILESDFSAFGLTAYLHIKKYCLEGKLSKFLFKPVHTTCKAARGGYLHGNVHKSALWCLEGEAGARGVTAGAWMVLEEQVLWDWGSCPSAWPLLPAAVLFFCPAWCEKMWSLWC